VPCSINERASVRTSPSATQRGFIHSITIQPLLERRFVFQHERYAPISHGYKGGKMSIAADAKRIMQQFEHSNANLTAIRTMANEIGKSQELAQYLWMHGGTKPRLLSLLVLELKAVDTAHLEDMIKDIERVEENDQRQLSDCLVANVIIKKSALKKEASSWLAATSIIKQRIFWSLQARTVKAENTELNRQLLETLEQHMAEAPETVQEHMN